jgi:hypothetical protein
MVFQLLFAELVVIFLGPVGRYQPRRAGFDGQYGGSDRQRFGQGARSAVGSSSMDLLAPTDRQSTLVGTGHQ